MSEQVGLFIGAISLGFIHGIEPGHGWPVAAAAALDRSQKWLWGLAASFILGIGHLISSIAMVLVFFWAKTYFKLHEMNHPITLPGDIEIGGPMGITAGILLIGMGFWEFLGGHSHEHDHSEHNHNHSNHDRETEAGNAPHTTGGFWSTIRSFLPFFNDHDQDHSSLSKPSDRSLWGIAGFAFLLGFIHEEEFEIIGLCMGSDLCLELMLVYALTVIVGIVGLTMALIAGYEHFEEKLQNLDVYLPIFSAGILIFMGIGFITGFF